MPPLETLSPFDFLEGPERQDVFFMGSISATKLDAKKSLSTGGKLKKVLSVPKALSEKGQNRRRSLSNLFKGRSRKSSINEDENENSENLGSSLPFLSGSKNKSSSEKAENRDRSKSENETPNTGIEHPHQYAGINKISRSAQTSVDVGLPSIWSPKFKRKTDKSTQTLPDLPKRAIVGGGRVRTRIRTNPRIEANKIDFRGLLKLIEKFAKSKNKHFRFFSDFFFFIKFCFCKLIFNFFLHPLESSSDSD
mgnify:CR=1 FL=1